ncbi:MAG: hypothetical protein HUU50_08560 [Candidatus Brocadiae bacterium]|nr:hypothetical protein [Candidatus Brocadiia bacterium]
MKKCIFLFFLLIFHFIGWSATLSVQNNLQLWLKADAGVTTSGGYVSTWADQSGNARNASQSDTSKRPVLVSNAINGLSAIRFDGSNDGLLTSAFQAFPNKRGSVFIVAKSVFDGTTGHMLGTYYSSGITWQFYHNQDTLLYWDSVSADIIPQSIVNSEFKTYSIVRNSNTNINFYQNGTLKTNFEIADNQPEVKPLNIGSNVNHTNLEAFNGDIAEILIYGTSLSESERASVEQYLGEKYFNLAPVPEPSSLLLVFVSIFIYLYLKMN